MASPEEQGSVLSEAPDTERLRRGYGRMLSFKRRCLFGLGLAGYGFICAFLVGVLFPPFGIVVLAVMVVGGLGLSLLCSLLYIGSALFLASRFTLIDLIITIFVLGGVVGLLVAGNPILGILAAVFVWFTALIIALDIDKTKPNP